MRYYGNDGFIFAWDLGVSFLGVRNFLEVNDEILRAKSGGGQGNKC